MTTAKENLLAGKVAIITGASEGLGFEIARQFILQGASLCVCSRDRRKISLAESELKRIAGKSQSVSSMTVDVSDSNRCDEFIADAINKHQKIDILVNNAGVYGPFGEVNQENWSDWIQALQINIFGSVYMSSLVVPIMKKNMKGKIIQLSGGGATNPLPFISAYACSKAAIVRYAETLAEELRDHNIDINSIAPGPLNTNMLEMVLEAGPETVGYDFYEKSKKQKATGGVPLEVGARLAVFLASEKSNGISGKLISAVWDNWEIWPEHIAELNSSDIYTLRRIVGKDRQKKWGDK
ncbi:MAG: SDR family oxidoreductase [Pseudomonadota bacterium]|nr:SDR family oxidoreductase [Pseudomonadota bacterium]